MLLGLAVTGLAIGAVAAVGWVVHVGDDGPDARHAQADQPRRDLRGLRRRRDAARLHPGATLRAPITEADIPPVARQATVAIEDRRFFKHKGVDFEGILRAAVKNLEGGDIQGGSTLTMQLVRNLYTGERARSGVAGYKRKIREAKLAEDLENRHPGRQGKIWILDKYLNNVPYGTVGGQTAVGVQAASRMFFDKPASELTLRQAALLAGLPQAPSLYNPFLDPQRRARRDEVLQQMADQGYISQATAPAHDRRGLGVRRNRFFTERREGYFFDYVKPSSSSATAWTRSARAGCASTRRSTCTCSAWRARAWTASSARPTAPRRSSRSTPATARSRRWRRPSQLRRLEVQPRRAGPPPAGLDVQGHGAHDGAAPRRRPRHDDLRVASR